MSIIEKNHVSRKKRLTQKYSKFIKIYFILRGDLGPVHKTNMILKKNVYKI